MNLRNAIEAGDAQALLDLLSASPELANAPIRWGRNESRPLHFLSDKVFDGTISGDRAADMARALLAAGADLEDQNGDPLNAAVSLGATAVAFVLLEAGARVDQRSSFNETALHWAAVMGNDGLVRELLARGAPLDVRDVRYSATPLGWARHGLTEAPPAGSSGHREVIAQLVAAGAPE